MERGKLLILALLAVLVAVSSCGKKSSGPGDRVKIIFITVPAGASVYFDGELMGQTGQISGVELGPGEGALVVMAEEGTHSYRIELEGYMTESVRTYTVVGKSTKQIRKELKRLVEVTVNTSPDGASVSLDSDKWSGTTPATLQDVPEGEHSLLIRKSGYFMLSEIISIGRDKPSVSLSYELIPKPKIKTFEFTTVMGAPENNGKRPPFKLEIFRGGEENPKNVGICVQTKAIFSEPAPKDFTAFFDAYRGGERLELKEEARKRDVASGATSASFIFSDFWVKTQTEKYLMRPGTYSVTLTVEDEVLEVLGGGVSSFKVEE